MCSTEAIFQDPFDMQLCEARRIIRDHGDAPEQFRIMRTPKKQPGGHIYVREYTVTVSRGEVSPVTYPCGDGRDWVVLFAHDLHTHRFSVGADRRGPEALTLQVNTFN